MFTDGDPALDTTDAKEMLVALVTGQEKMLERMDRLEHTRRHERRTSRARRRASRSGPTSRIGLLGLIAN